MKSKKPITTDKDRNLIEDLIIPVKKLVDTNIKINNLIEKEKYILEIENFCSNEGILPSDLIESYKNRNKAVKVVKNDNKGVFMNVEDALSDNSGLSKMQLEIRKKKLGF